MWQPSWACPTEGCFYPPTLFTDVAAVVDDRAGRDLRAGAGDDDLPHAGGIGRAGEQHAVRARGERVDGEHQPRARHRAEDQGRRGVDQLDESVRRGGGVRRLSREWVRARGRPRGDVGVSEAGRRSADAGSGRERRSAQRRLARRPADRDQRPDFPPSIARPSCSSAASRRAPIRATRAASSRRRASWSAKSPEGNRKDIRNAVEAAHAAAAAGREPRATTAARSSTTSPRISSARARRVRAPHRRDDRRAARDARSRKWTRRSRGCSPTRAWADKYDGAVHSVPIRGVSLAMNEPIGVIGIACPDEFPLLGLDLARRRRRSPRATRRSSIPSQTHPLAATDFYQRARDVGRARRRDQHRDRRQGRAGEGARRARRRRSRVVLRPPTRA